MLDEKRKEVQAFFCLFVLNELYYTLSFFTTCSILVRFYEKKRRSEKRVVSLDWMVRNVVVIAIIGLLMVFLNYLINIVQIG